MLELQKKDSVKKSDIKALHKNVRLCVVTALKKIFERCPVKSVLRHNAVAFKPTSMFTKAGNTLKEVEEVAEVFGHRESH